MTDRCPQLPLDFGDTPEAAPHQRGIPYSSDPAKPVEERNTPGASSPAGPVLELVHGDGVAGMRERGPAFADVIVTSPPYNLGIQYNSYDDTMPRSDYLAWIREWAEVCRKALSPAGSLFLNVGSKPSDPWLALDVAFVFREVMVLQNTLHWIKSISLPDYDGEMVSYGHYKPINSRRFVNDCHEYVFHFTLSGGVELDRLAIGVPYQDKSNIERWTGKADRRCRGNAWFIPYETIMSRDRDRPHPATFPVQLAEQCLKLHGLDRIGLAVDPFLGLGSTGAACARLGINFLGFELDAEYLKIAQARIQSARPAAQEPQPTENRV